jgi:hypothetical protein
MTTRYEDHVVKGDHASRPLATDVPNGAQYSCTDHTVIYQSDGATWSDYFDGGGAVITDHGGLGGLSDDDHPQYATNVEFDNHKARHQDGGADEISLTGLAGLSATPQTPAAHKTSHEDGGADEISLTGLAGLSATPQTPAAHKTSHQDGGADEIVVTGLSGLLADPQTPLFTVIDAKGDLIAGTAADTAGKLPAAANGAGLVTASGETTGLKWRLNNDGAAVAPTVNEDSGDGYSVGSRWIDTTADKEYVCLDATVGAAVWTETTSTGGGGGGGSGSGGLTVSQVDLTSLLTIVNAATWYDVVSLSLPAGSYILLAQASVRMNASSGWINLRLWDHTTVYDEGPTYLPTGSGINQTVALTHSLTLAAPTTVYLAARSDLGSSSMKVNATGSSGVDDTTNKATRLIAIRTDVAASGARFIGCRVYNSTVQSIPNNTVTAVTFDSEFYDTDGIHSTSSNTSRFTVPPGMGGKWRISFEGYWDSASGTVQIVYFYKNGSEFSPKLRRRIDASSSGVVEIVYPRSATLDLVAGDYIEVYVLQNKGSAGSLGAADYETSCEFVKVDSGSVYVDPATCQGRLTLTTAVPVTTTDVTAATTLYFTPFRGNRIATYSGALWSDNSFTEKSITLAGLTAGLPYDVFIVDSTLALELTAWTNGTTRATALVTQDGVLCKTGSLTRRYLGTICIAATGQCEDSVSKRFVWNYYNQVERPLRVVDTTNNWTWATTGTWRQARATATNQVEFIHGVVERPVIARTQCYIDGGAPSVGVGLDSTTVNSAQVGNEMAAGRGICFATYTGYPAVGYHYLAWLEYNRSGTASYVGDDGGAYMQSGMTAEAWA